MELGRILSLVLSVIFIILIINLFIALLPVILIGLLAIYLYNAFKRATYKEPKVKEKNGKIIIETEKRNGEYYE